MYGEWHANKGKENKIENCFMQTFPLIYTFPEQRANPILTHIDDVT